MTPKLEAIIEEAVEHFRNLARDNADKIEEGMQKTVEQSQLQETPATFTLNFGLKVKLDENAMEHALSFSNKTRFSVETEIPDPDQMKLKGMEE